MYKILEFTSISYLERAVQKLMKEGWKPQGGVNAVGGGSTGTGNAYYQQAMVKELQ